MSKEDKKLSHPTWGDEIRYGFSESSVDKILSKVGAGEPVIVLECRGVAVRTIAMMDKDDPKGAKRESTILEIAAETVGESMRQVHLGIWEARNDKAASERVAFDKLVNDESRGFGKGDKILVTPSKIGFKNGMLDLGANADGVEKYE